MAFRVLREDELLFFTDDERARYEIDLDLYRQRERFVEQLEQQKKIKFESYQPELKPITEIGPIEPISEFNPSYNIAEVPKQEKPIIEFSEFEKPAYTPQQVPIVTVDTDLPTGFSYSMEKYDTKIPSVTSPSIFVEYNPNIHYQQQEAPNITMPNFAGKAIKFEPVEATIPTAFKEIDYPQYSADKFMTEERNVSELLPTLTTPCIHLSEFQLPDGENRGLPIVEVPTAGVSKFQTPFVSDDIEYLEIEFSAPDIQIKKISSPSVTLPDKVEVKTSVDYEYAYDKKPNIEVPAMTTPTSVNYSYKKVDNVEKTIYPLPLIPTLSVGDFAIQEIDSTPVVPKVESSIGFVDITEFKAPDLTLEQKPALEFSFDIKPYKGTEESKYEQYTYPEINIPTDFTLLDQIVASFSSNVDPGGNQIEK